MTNTPENTNNSSKDNSTGYYAVDAQRVIQVFELFQMRPSHFSASGKAGAQGVYYDARKIIENRTNNKWGHHTKAAINNFCHFTQSENGFLLPWQELIEHHSFYDGMEGAGRRTGNLLLTENRVQLQHAAMATARKNSELSQLQLAEKLALPLRFIEVLERGDWKTVTENISNLIANALDVDENTIVTQIPETVEHTESAVSNYDSKPDTIGKKMMRKAWLLVAIFGLIFWAGYQFYPLSLNQDNNKIFSKLSGCWDWSNGAYIVINDDGTAHNGPFAANWKIVDVSKRLYTVTWPSFVDTLSLSEDGDVLSGKNNFNFPISASRKKSNGSGIMGTWLWSNGTTVIFHSDNTMSTSLIKGTWHKAGTNWIIEWPLVDSVTLSANGHNLKVNNPYAVFTAKRNVNCKKNSQPND